MVIFIDTAEALLDIPFLAEDLFEWIWHCHCLRTIYPIYQRLTFVVLGNAIPTDLIKNKTLLSTGRAIAPENFQLADTSPLQTAFENRMVDPTQLLAAIFHWTNGHPLLTQKLCAVAHSLLNEFSPPTQPTAPHAEALEQWVAHLATTRIIDNWNRQDDLPYLWEMCYLLTHSQYKKPLTTMYQHILAGHPVQLDGDRLQAELIMSGLVIARDGHLHSGNEIYRHIFGAI